MLILCVFKAKFYGILYRACNYAVVGYAATRFNGKYRQVSNIRRIYVGNSYIIVDDSDVGGAWPVGAAPTSSSFST